MESDHARPSGRPFGLLFTGNPDFPAIRRWVATGDVPRPDYMIYLEDHGFNAVTVPGSRPFRGVKSWLVDLLGPSALLAIRSIAQEHRGFLALGEDVGAPFAFALSLIGSKTPVFMLAHGTYLHNRWFSLLMRFVRRIPNLHVFALSEPVREQFITRFGVSAERCVVIGNPVDTQFYKPSPAPPSGDKPLVVSAGVVRRDYPTLFEAVAPLPVEVSVAANSMWVENSDAPIAHPDNVTISQPPLGTGLRDLYIKAAMVAVPLQQTDYACGYSTIFEAMAMGKPVIATRTAGQTELLRDGENGFLVEPGDAAGMRDRIMYLVDHPQEAARMGRNGRAMVERKLSVDVMTATIRKFMEQHSAPRAPAPSKGMPWAASRHAANH